jgi:hypothetical protein
MKIVERIPAHYEVQEVEDLGRCYRWCPEQVVLECGACGTRMTLKRSSLITSVVTCECGARCAASVREELMALEGGERNTLLTQHTLEQTLNATRSARTGWS